MGHEIEMSTNVVVITQSQVNISAWLVEKLEW